MRALLLLSTTAALLASLLSGCATGPTPTQIRLDKLDARVTKIERVVSNGSLVQLAQRQSSLEGQLRRLRGRLDSLQQSNQRLTRRQHAQYAALNKRVHALEKESAQQQAALQSAAANGASSSGGSAASSSTSSTAPSSSGAGNAGGSMAGVLPGVTPTEQTAYEQAFDALKAGGYSTAIHGFEGFLKTYPTSPLAPNAEYWLGEAHYVNQNFDAAEKCFRAVLKKWPNSDKVSAALFDLGNTLLAQGRVHEGRATLRKVIKRFPGTSLAKRAASALKHAAK